MMPDFRPRWVIMVGKLYFSGLGRCFDRCMAGHVFSLLRKNAFKFSSLEEARAYADSVGGQVFRV